MPETFVRSFQPDLEVRVQGGQRIVEGIAVPFGQAQRIHAELTEQFAHGAFAHQLRAMHRVPMTRGHLVFGGSVIGRIHEAREDTRGLWVSMRVSATPAGDETLTLVQDGVLDELSIGFRAYPKRDKVLPDGTVERRRADLTEVAVELAGAYGQKAKILATRAAEDEHDEHDDEQDGRARAERAAALLAGVPLLPIGVLIP
ncbi:MAG: HK97 family phage prohead protease [Pseudonocardia sp.]|nr:HK97 family phage prohead protease [Pseudonocardia sp.]